MANYVDNKKLFDCFVEWRDARVAAEAKGDPEPQPPAYISESIMLIAQKYSTIWKFNGYSFREDMVGDAIIDIVKCFRNFDTTQEYHEDPLEARMKAARAPNQTETTSKAPEQPQASSSASPTLYIKAK